MKNMFINLLFITLFVCSFVSTSFSQEIEGAIIASENNKESIRSFFSKEHDELENPACPLQLFSKKEHQINIALDATIKKVSMFMGKGKVTLKFYYCDRDWEFIHDKNYYNCEIVLLECNLS